MKKTTLVLAMGLMISGAANAALEANIGATSNYVWRGMTQTDNQAAVSGGLDYTNESGFYAGTWASNIDWAASGTGTEVDFYAGVSSDDYDLGVIYFYYPDHSNSDFSEVYGSYTLGGVTAGIAYTVSGVDETAAGNEQYIKGDTYYYLSTGGELSDGWSLSGTLGYYDFEDDGVAASDTSFGHFQLDLSKSVEGFADVTMSVSQAEAESGDNDPKLFVSLSKSF